MNPEHWLGAAVRDRRAQLGISLQELATRAGIHFHMLEDIEAGLHFPSPHYLWRLLQGLDTSFKTLREMECQIDNQTDTQADTQADN